ncbi:hypothetical protein Dda_8038 [Drechslerella dactyloides]|uniref:G-patch domain-containing protein n=1 Tax=Drechslerella dactyloides TaxID=74499 RepID=A0AAD6NGC8_DREDA|nr:hypothetical protein Dda_8038 [Drechslerella dactyloides]
MASNAGRGMASLYADLLEPKPPNLRAREAPSAISKSPVVFAAHDTQASTQDVPNSSSDQPASVKKPPIPRRQLPVQQKNIKRAGISSVSKLPRVDAATEPHDSASTLSIRAPPATRAPLVKSTLEDWATNDDGDDVNGFYANSSRQRGGRKRRRKNKEKEFERSTQSWDDIYDPTRPNLYEEYKESEERDNEIREWRDRLYGRRRAFSSEESDDEGDQISRNRFPPPTNMEFAPPPGLDYSASQETPSDPAPMLDAATGDEIWMMRAKMTQQSTQSSGVLSFAQKDRSQGLSLLGNPSESSPLLQNDSTALIDHDFSKYQGPNTTISRAPVIYNLPPAPPEIISGSQPIEAETSDDESPFETAAETGAGRSIRPGQKGFAERLMSKYGWTKGTGLGANSTGMVHALQVKAAKGKDSKGVGKIMDKNKRRNSQEESKFGKMSEVIVLHRMVDGLEAEDPAVLMQEIGDECSEKYGRIERVHIVHKKSEDMPSKVFVQFTSQLSALRAVNALEGRLFNGNVIEARFFDAERFEEECIS